MIMMALYNLIKHDGVSIFQVINNAIFADNDDDDSEDKCKVMVNLKECMK